MAFIFLDKGYYPQQYHILPIFREGNFKMAQSAKKKQKLKRFLSNHKLTTISLKFNISWSMEFGRNCCSEFPIPL